jgi:hypothetical protein
MKVVYRGHRIDAYRERAMGGWMNLYFSVFRVSDGLEVTSGFTSGSDTVRDYIRYMKERVDGFIADPSEEFPDASDEEIERHKKLMAEL